MKKVLWVVDSNMQDLIEKAKYIGAQTICVRTTNSWLKKFNRHHTPSRPCGVRLAVARRLPYGLRCGQNTLVCS
jgi:hypothetical protein